LPLGAWLCFHRHWGALGLWSGLSLALILIGMVLLFVWSKKVKSLLQSSDRVSVAAGVVGVAS
jgi:MATE family multidrug resistance protein